MKRITLLTGLWLLLTGSHSLLATSIKKDVYVHAGMLRCVDSTYIPSYSISFVDSFMQQQELLRLAPGDSLMLSIFNRDTVAHSFFWDSDPSTSVLVSAGGNALIEYTSYIAGGDYLRGDKSSDPYMGLVLPLLNMPLTKASFLWDIHEKNRAFSEELIINQPVDFDQYDPDYFFINGLSNPETMDDSLSRVRGNEGDSIYIFILNSGMAAHSLHFHGYHLEIKQSSYSSSDKGKSKDTFPIRAGEIMLLLLVPDKPGEYPVHDHNLIAVSGGGIYPNGMFTTLLIK